MNWKPSIRKSSPSTAAVRRTSIPCSAPPAAKRGTIPSCGDEITLELQVEEGRVKDAAFTGAGCAISQASTDIMIDLMRGKSVEEAKALADKFIAMIKREITDEAELEDLEEALALKNIAHMPARVKCALLAWRTMREALEK